MKSNPAVRRMLWAPDHPLATKNGYVLESRKLLYDRIGAGPQICHWCATTIVWKVKRGRGTHRGHVVADHVDGNWRNDSPDNVVPACQGCNGTRFKLVGEDEPYILRKNGTRLRAIRRNCERCNSAFLTQPSDAKRHNRGRFCSMSCARRKPT
jgi:hypothetical protein